MALTKIFEDLFTETSVDTALDSHTPNTGTSWTRVYQLNTEQILVDASDDNALPEDRTLARGAVYTADATYGVADYQVSINQITGAGSGDDYITIFVRYTDTENHYVLESGSGGTSQDPALYKNVSNSYTLLGSWDQTKAVKFTTGDIVILEAIGSDIAAYVGNVSYIYVTDSSLASAGKAALGMGAYWRDTAGDTTVTMVVDDFTVYTLDISYTSWFSPTTTGEISNTWTNPSNAYSSDDADAVANAVNDAQDYGDFGITGPSGSDTIHGIQIKIEGASDGTGTSGEGIGVELSWDNGTTWTTRLDGSDIFHGTSDQTYIWGHSCYTWGRTWSASDFSDANFRIRLTYIDESSTLREIYVDHIQVRVFYEVAAPAAGIVSMRQLIGHGQGTR